MSNQSLQESLSALMDNEADELEIRRVLQSSESDPALRSTWDRYQIARAVMHKEPWQPKIDLSAGIAAVIAGEPEPVAAPKAPRVWQNLSRLAVAASVTMAVLVGVNMFNQDGAPADPAMVADLPPVVDAPVAVAPAVARLSGWCGVGWVFPAAADEWRRRGRSESTLRLAGTAYRQLSASAR